MTPWRTRNKRTMKYAMDATIARIGTPYNTPIRTASHMRSPLRELRQEHGRAGGLARFERTMRGGRVLQRKRLARRRLNLACEHQAKQFAGHRRNARAIRRVRHERRACRVQRALLC